MSSGKIITPGRISPDDQLCLRCASRVPMSLGVPSGIRQPDGSVIQSISSVDVLACSHGLVTGPGALTALVLQCGAFSEGLDDDDPDAGRQEESDLDDDDSGEG